LRRIRLRTGMILLLFGIRHELSWKELEEIEWKNMKKMKFIRNIRKMIEMTEFNE
jgi:hypothetical protein